MTTDSPCTLGRVTTRRSTWWPSMLSPTRPSCGHAPLGDVQLGHDLDAAHDARDHRPRDDLRLRQHAVDAQAHAHGVRLGLEVDVRRALLHRLGDDLVGELDDRRVVDRLAQIDDLGLGELVLGPVDEIRDDVLHPPQARHERLEVLPAGDGRADLHARHDRDVVHRDDVRRVGHRDEQRALPAVGDRHRFVAACRDDRDQAGRRHVDLERREVDVVQAVTLGERARQVVVADRPRGQELLLGGRARGPGGGDRRLDLLGVAQTELDDDVGEEPRTAVAAPRLGDPVPAVALLGRQAHVRQRRCDGGAAGVGGQVGGGVGHGGSATAVRIAERSGAIPVQAANERAPWRTRISSPPTTVTPRSRAASSSAVPPGR